MSDRIDPQARFPRLPVLDNLHVAAPCKASWDDMVGDERSRFCGQCDKNVYNLSAMSRPEAEALLIEKEGRLCVRYYQRADGTILTADCPDGLRRRRRKTRVVAAAFGAMSAVAAAASLVPRSAPQSMPVVTQGEIAATPPSPPPIQMMGAVAPVRPPVMGKVAAPVVGQARPRPQPAVMGEPAFTPRPEKPHHE